MRKQPHLLFGRDKAGEGMIAGRLSSSSELVLSFTAGGVPHERTFQQETWERDLIVMIIFFKRRYEEFR